MNNDEMEKKLLANGFTSNDINHMKKVIRRGIEDGDIEETLFSLTYILKQRFYNACLGLLLTIGIFTASIYLAYPMDIVTFAVYSSVTAFCFYCIYSIGPLVLTYKSYRYCKKYEKKG